MTPEMLEHNLYYQIILILPYIVDYYIPVDIYNTLKNINNTYKSVLYRVPHTTDRIEISIISKLLLLTENHASWNCDLACPV